MQIWAEIHDGTTTYGIVKLSSASITQRLDAANTFEIGTVPTDYSVNAYLKIGRRVRVRALERGVEKVLIEGRILSRRMAGRMLYWKGQDGLDELRGENTLYALIYNQADMMYTVRDLVRRADGWDVNFQGTVEGFVSRRFDGEKILAALRWIAETYGYHFRAKTDQRRIVFGAMGDASGLRIIQAGRMTRELERMRDFALLATEPVLIEEAHDIENYLIPNMGPVDYGLTLERSDKASPFVIESTTGPDGRAVYFIQNSASVAAYGAWKAFFQPRELVLPVEVSANGVLNAANVLYEAAANHLLRHSNPYKSFSLSLAKLDWPVYPGQTVRLVYDGQILHKGQVMQYEQPIDEDLWVLEIQREYATDSVAVMLTVATIDRYPTDPAKLLVEAMRKIEAQRNQQVLTVDRDKQTDTVTISPTTTDSMTFEIQSSTAWVASARVNLIRASAVAPSLVTVSLDGVALPGLYFGSANDLEVTIDITQSIQSAAGVHTLSFSCQDSSGDIDVEVHLVEVLVGIGT